MKTPKQMALECDISGDYYHAPTDRYYAVAVRKGVAIKLGNYDAEIKRQHPNTALEFSMKLWSRFLGVEMTGTKYLRDLADRLMRVPVSYGINQCDVDELKSLANITIELTRESARDILDAAQICFMYGFHAESPNWLSLIKNIHTLFPDILKANDYCVLNWLKTR